LAFRLTYRLSHAVKVATYPSEGFGIPFREEKEKERIKSKKKIGCEYRSLRFAVPLGAHQPLAIFRLILLYLVEENQTDVPYV